MLAYSSGGKILLWLFLIVSERSALTGRASRLCRSEGVHALSPVILCGMYIPRPAKLLFTIDDAWNTFLEKFGDSVTPWTRLCVERMLACGSTEMGVRRYCCSSSDCPHSCFFCQSCKSKACSACGFKAAEQWVSQQSHILPDCDWQHITFTTPHLLWPFLAPA